MIGLVVNWDAARWIAMVALPAIGSAVCASAAVIVWAEDHPGGLVDRVLAALGVDDAIVPLEDLEVGVS